MKFNITEPMAKRMLLLEATSYQDNSDLWPLYHRIGEVFPHLKAEYSYLDWDKFNESKGE